MRARFHLVPCIFIPMLALAASPARANDGSPPEIFELIQEGQDVVVTFGILDPWGEPSIDRPFTLTRSGPEGDAVVFESRTFDRAEAAIRDPHCRFIDDDGISDPDEECAAAPASCEDCDEDGVPECPTALDSFDAVCVAYLTYDAVDACVPPGPTDYLLRESDGDYSDYFDAEGSLEVVDSGEECEAAGEGDGSGCSVSGVGGGGAPPLSLSLFMGLLGLVALRLRRNG
ncbi:MAG: hypothetical protein M0R80_27175 [Proteobacteria bacterium]|jgi:MYXO-CTERM domain-containing protein|nr:hypothetical protein [Pseudomonadota bacterium]